MNSNRSQGPSVFEYLDYREYLRDFYSFQKSKMAAYSFRVFAQKAKLSSPNYLKLVMDGDRRITDKMLPQFIRGLSLNGVEAKYFNLMIRFNDSSDPLEKRGLLEKLVNLGNRALTQSHGLNPSQEQALNHWSNWVIRELTTLDGFRADSQWMAEALRGEVTPSQAEEGFELLLDSGLIEKGDNSYGPVEACIKTEDEVVSALIRNLHVQFIELGVKSLFRDPISEREFSGLTIALAESQIPKFKQKIKDFRQRMNLEFSQPGDNSERVFHMEVMFYPVTKRGEPC